MRWRLNFVGVRIFFFFLMKAGKTEHFEKCAGWLPLQLAQVRGVSVVFLHTVVHRT